MENFDVSWKKRIYVEKYECCMLPEYINKNRAVCDIEFLNGYFPNGVH